MEGFSNTVLHFGQGAENVQNLKTLLDFQLSDVEKWKFHPCGSTKSGRVFNFSKNEPQGPAEL